MDRRLVALVLVSSLWARAARAETTAPTPTGAPVPTTAASPAPRPADRGRFATLWVTPLATHRFLGAGVEAGYRWRWLSALYRMAFLQNDYAPVDELVLQRTQRLVFELEADAQWSLPAITTAVGVGAAFMGDRVDSASALALANGQTQWTTSTDEHGRIRPMASVTMVGPLFEAIGSIYIGATPELRLALGVNWGRHPRR
jgi:hypothetical protein